MGSKWEKLKLWVAKKHDYFEKEYRTNEVAADEIEASVYRKVFEAMNSFDEQEHRQINQAAAQAAAPGRGPDTRRQQRPTRR